MTAIRDSPNSPQALSPSVESKASPYSSGAYRTVVTSSHNNEQSAEHPVPPYVVKAFGRHLSALRLICADIVSFPSTSRERISPVLQVVEGYQPEEWRQLQAWYQDCDDPEINRFR